MSAMKCRIPCLVAALFLSAGPLRPAEPAAPAPAPAPAQAASPAKEFPLQSYVVVGSYFAKNSRLADLGWTEAQFEAFIEGVRATFQGHPYPVDAQSRALHEEIGRRLQQLSTNESQARQEEFSDPAKLEAYMKDMAKRFKMERTDSGLAYSILSSGPGSRPAPEDSVVLSCRVTAADAKTDLPQLTVKQTRFKVADLMPGMAEVVQMMAAGGAAIMILPPDLTYGSGEWPPGIDRAPLLYMVVLDEVIPAP